VAMLKLLDSHCEFDWQCESNFHCEWENVILCIVGSIISFDSDGLCKYLVILELFVKAS